MTRFLRRPRRSGYLEDAVGDTESRGHHGHQCDDDEAHDHGSGAASGGHRRGRHVPERERTGSAPRVVEWDSVLADGCVDIGGEGQFGQLVVGDADVDAVKEVDITTVAGPLALAGSLWECSDGRVAEVMSWQTNIMKQTNTMN